MRPHVRGQQIRILPRLRVVSVHRTAHGDEVQVVAVIHHRVNALHTSRLDVGAIDGSRLLVRLDRSLVVAGTNVDVRRHVNDVPRAWCQRGKFVRSS